MVTARVEDNMVKTPLSRQAWQMKIIDFDEENENSKSTLTETQEQILREMVFVQQEDEKLACRSVSSTDEAPSVPYTACTAINPVTQCQLSSSQEDLVNQISCHAK